MAEAKVLVADVPAGIASIETILKGHANVLPTQKLDEALRCLDMGVDVIVCGIHFEDSRMFDLPRIVKADPRFRTLPFICFWDLESELQPTFPPKDM